MGFRVSRHKQDMLGTLLNHPDCKGTANSTKASGDQIGGIWIVEVYGSRARDDLVW